MCSLGSAGGYFCCVSLNQFSVRIRFRMQLRFRLFLQFFQRGKSSFWADTSLKQMFSGVKYQEQCQSAKCRGLSSDYCIRMWSVRFSYCRKLGMVQYWRRRRRMSFSSYIVCSMFIVQFDIIFRVFGCFQKKSYSDLRMWKAKGSVQSSQSLRKSTSSRAGISSASSMMKTSSGRRLRSRDTSFCVRKVRRQSSAIQSFCRSFSGKWFRKTYSILCRMYSNVSLVSIFRNLSGRGFSQVVKLDSYITKAFITSFSSWKRTFSRSNLWLMLMVLMTRRGIFRGIRRFLVGRLECCITVGTSQFGSCQFGRYTYFIYLRRAFSRSFARFRAFSRCRVGFWVEEFSSFFFVFFLVVLGGVFLVFWYLV